MVNIFNKEKFESNFNLAVQQFDHIEDIVNNLDKKNIENVFFIGSGGAYSKFINMDSVIFGSFNLPFVITSPEELISLYLDKITPKSLIIFGTKTGTTSELIVTLNIIKEKFEKSPSFIGFIGDDNTKIDSLNINFSRISSVDTDVHLILLGWFLILLNNNINLETKKLIKEELESVGYLISEVLNKQKLYLNEAISKSDIASKQMWVGSGNLWGEIRCYSNYVLEEIQWIFSQPVHSSEYFHGPFELTDENFVPNIVLNTDKNRKQDLRVKKFVDRFDKDYILIDMEDYRLPYKSSEVKDIVEPYILNQVFDIMLNVYTNLTGKSIKTRRYYRKIDY